MKNIVILFMAFVLVSSQSAIAEVHEKVVDIPTRPDVTQRFLLLSPENPRAAAILFAGGDGGLDLSDKGSISFLSENFLVRNRRLFAEKGFAIAVIDAPSDRRQMALKGFRQKPEHVEDVKGMIAWLKGQYKLPVWLVGTSNGTLSAAFVATELNAGQGGPDGVVLTSTILKGGDKTRPVPDMPIEKIKIPVLVVHHEQDGCKHCPFDKVPELMQKLSGSSRKQLITYRGGTDRGDPCNALAYHGYNGLDNEVVTRIADWINAK